MNLIEAHAHELLSLKGYSHCRLRYCFGNDDRLVFFGSADVRRLAQRFLQPEERAVIQRLVRQGLTLEVEAPNGLESPQPEVTVNSNNPESISSSEQVIVSLLVTAARSDVESIARTLEVEGRALIDAGSVPWSDRKLITFKTPTLTYEVERVPGDDPLGVLGDYDAETRSRMIDGELKYVDFVCRGVDESGRIAVEKRIREVCEETPLSPSPAVAREVLNEAINAARPKVQEALEELSPA